MLYYSVVAFISTLLVLISSFSKSKLFDKVSIVLVILSLSILQGFKWEFSGTDTAYYISMFSWDLSFFQWIERGIEPFFILIVKFLKYLGLEDSYYYFLTFSLIFNTLILSTIYKFNRYRVTLFISYFFFSLIYLSHFNILRQSIALAFFIYSIPFIIERSKNKASLIIFLGTMFHYSLAFFIFIPYIYNYIIRNFYTSVFFATLISLIYTVLYEKFVILLSLISGADRYLHYTSSIEDRSSLFLYLGYVFIFLVSYILYSFRRNDDFKFYLFLLYLYCLLSTCIMFLGLPYEGPGRLSVYFSASFIFIFAFMLDAFDIRYRLFLNVLICFFMILFFYLVIYLANFHQVFPYSFSF